MVFINNGVNEKNSREWLSIDISPLEEMGFSEKHINQLRQSNITLPEIVQESIYHFAFGLKYSDIKKKYDHPIRVLMGVLKRGDAWVEEKYRSPQEIAHENFLKRKKEESERKKQLYEEGKNVAYENWLNNISDAERKEIAGKEKGFIQQAKLRTYFNENIWDMVKKEYVLT